MPLTDITWTAGDDALGGGPATVEVSPTGSGSLVSFGVAIPAGSGTDYIFNSVDVSGGAGLAYGFSLAGGLGSVSPGTINGAIINNIQSSPGGAPPTLTVNLDGVLPQNWFTSITVNGFTFLTSAATFTPQATQTIWQWNGDPFHAGLIPMNVV